MDLYHSDKYRCNICREYDIATSLFDKWVKQEENSCSFHEKDNRTPEQEELIGHSSGKHKTVALVKEAFQSIKGNLKEICLFHTDR